MTDPTPAIEERQPAEPPNRSSYTLNQFVAYNVGHWRRALGYTQEQLGTMLAELTGRPWSKATVSAAERGWDGKRIRQFDADDLLALSLALRVPILGLLLPPDEFLPAEDGGPSVGYELVFAESVPHTRSFMEAFISMFVPEIIEPPGEHNYRRFAARLERQVDTQFGKGTYARLRMVATSPSTEEGLQDWRDDLVRQGKAINTILDTLDTEMLVARARLKEIIEPKGGLKGRRPGQIDAPEPRLPDSPDFGISDPIGFATALRGYDKRQVDRFVTRAEDEIATLAAEREQAYMHIQSLAGQIEVLKYRLNEAEKQARPRPNARPT
jgi:DivIVA domain-containing protein